MCGISFVINDRPITFPTTQLKPGESLVSSARNTDDFMRDTFLAGQVRGTDSAGLFVLNKDSVPVIHKAGIGGAPFIGQVDAYSMLHNIPHSRVAVGHVRSATVGKISRENAHPFKVSREDGTYIIGVHNGTLTNWRRMKDAEKFTVDSEWLFHMLSVEGHSAFEYFDGAFALVWYDSARPDSLFMARNEQRPLHYMIAEDGHTMLGCSELGMLRWLAERNTLKHHKQHPNPYYLLPGKIYEFDLTRAGEYTEAEYAAYDPSTQALPYSHANLYPTKGGWDEWDQWGGRGSGYNLYREDSEEIMGSVKKALQSARNYLFPAVKTEADSELVTEEDLETAIMDAVRDHEESKAMIEYTANRVPWGVPAAIAVAIAKGEVFLDDIKGTSVTSKERGNAVDCGCYGMVVNFDGNWYDEEQRSCLGTYNLTENGAINTYNAEVKYIKKSVADEAYLNKEAGTTEFCVVVGVHDSVEWMMLEPLTADQHRFLEEEATTTKQAVH